MNSQIYDYVIIGSGFGGSVSAMRLTEKGYSVLVIERGKRFNDDDFPKSNWNLPKFLWLPKLRLHGFFEMTFMNGLLALHGSGVGGGSLTYGNVLMEPSDELFSTSWQHLADWKNEGDQNKDQQRSNQRHCAHFLNPQRSRKAAFQRCAVCGQYRTRLCCVAHISDPVGKHRGGLSAVGLG